jgi:hypothetical protein
LKDKRVADATHGTRRDHPLIHELDCVSAAGPQSVDDGLNVLLVDDEIVRTWGRQAWVGAVDRPCRGVIERNG